MKSEHYCHNENFIRSIRAHVIHLSFTGTSDLESRKYETACQRTRQELVNDFFINKIFTVDRKICLT